MDLSVIIPVKDERDNLRPLHEQLHQAVDPLKLAYEIVFVDDGSIDGSFAILEELAGADPLVKVIRLRRNFGQSAAMQAGIDFSTGAVVVTMDGDLQNPPSAIPQLLEKLAEGFDAVLGLRAQRHDNYLLRMVPSLVSNWLIRKVMGVEIRDLGCTLRAMRRDLAESLQLYGDMHRFVPVLAKETGARLAQIEVEHRPRVAGKTKYNLMRTFRVVLDLMTLKFMQKYMSRPMHVMGAAGLVSMALGTLCLLSTIWIKANQGPFITGNPLLHLGLLLELVGVQFFSLGLIGELFVRIYFQGQGRKLYHVRTTLNLHRKE